MRTLGPAVGSSCDRLAVSVVRQSSPTRLCCAPLLTVSCICLLYRASFMCRMCERSSCIRQISFGLGADGARRPRKPNCLPRGALP
jgi:hypothetical protein